MSLDRYLQQLTEKPTAGPTDVVYITDSGVGQGKKVLVQTLLKAVVKEKLRFAAATEKTIASGAITISQDSHTVDTEADAAADDLETINGGTAEQFLILRPAAAGRDVTLKHNVGNILTADGSDVTLSDTGFALLLYDGTNWRVLVAGSGNAVLQDGSAPLTADWDAGSHQIRAETFHADVADGTAPLVIVSTTRVANLNADMVDGQHAADLIGTGDLDDFAWKAPVRVATTEDITLSGEQTIDGVAVVAGDRVLVKDQSTAAENGIYEASASSWSRASDFAAGDNEGGATVVVQEGTAAADTVWICTNNKGADAVGTDGLSFTDITSAGGDHTLGSHTDAQFENPQDNDLVAYDASSGNYKLQNAAEAGLAKASHTHAASAITSGVLAHERGGLEADTSGYNGVPLISGGSTVELKHNFSATSDPTASADTDAGYRVGSLWYRTDTDEAFTCLDATAGTAVWKKISDAIAEAALGDLSNVTITSITDGELLKWDEASSAWINATKSELGLDSGSPPFDDSSPIVHDTADGTKLFRIDAGLITAGKTRVMKVPDRDIDFDAFRVGNLLVGTGAELGTEADHVVAVAVGAAPYDSPAGTVQYYADDISSGSDNAAPHWRLETGDVIKLYKVASWSLSNVSTDRTLDANNVTLDELADIVGTLISDIQNTGIFD